MGSLMSSLKTGQPSGREETRAVGMGAETEGACVWRDGCGSQCKGTQLKASVGTADKYQGALCSYFPPILWSRSTWLDPALPCKADYMDCKGGHPGPLSWSW